MLIYAAEITFTLKHSLSAAADNECFPPTTMKRLLTRVAVLSHRQMLFSCEIMTEIMLINVSQSQTNQLQRFICYKQYLIKNLF
jgi:hypothetical protein